MRIGTEERLSGLSLASGIGSAADLLWFKRMSGNGANDPSESLRVIGSDAPRGRKTANQIGASKPASPCSWALAGFGKAAYTLVHGDVISSSRH